MVATDGSAGAHLAFETVLSSLMYPSDKLIVTHIFNNEKTYLPFDMQPEALKQKYLSLTLDMGTRCILQWEESNPKISTKEHMIAIAQKDNASVIVVGMNGRKGPKA